MSAAPLAAACFWAKTVPNGEKLFSVFEPHTQLYQRGKAGEPVQFGRQMLVYEDGAGFITHIFLMPRDAGRPRGSGSPDPQAAKAFGRTLRYASFDRGFHSSENQQSVGRDCGPSLSADARVRPVAAARKRRRASRFVNRVSGIQVSNRRSTPCRAAMDWNAAATGRDRGFSRYIQLGASGPQSSRAGKDFGGARGRRVPCGGVAAKAHGCLTLHDSLVLDVRLRLLQAVVLCYSPASFSSALTAVLYAPRHSKFISLHSPMSSSRRPRPSFPPAYPRNRSFQDRH